MASSGLTWMIPADPSPGCQIAHAGAPRPAATTATGALGAEILGTDGTYPLSTQTTLTHPNLQNRISPPPHDHTQ